MDVSTIWDFCGEVVGSIRPRKGYVPATVTRIDADGTVWVTTGDGTEAPASTCAAGVAVGDVVNVSWSGAQMGVVGNASDPAAGTSTVRAVRKAAESAGRLAEDAKSIAEATGQFFWHDTNGAHISTEPDNPTGSRNALWNSLGMLFRAGATNLLAIVAGTDSGMDVYDGQGNDEDNIIASHRGSGSRIGYLSGFNTIIQSGLFAIRFATDRLFSVTTDGWQNNVYFGGSTIPSGLHYSDSQLLTIADYLNGGCTVSGTDIYDPQGEKTGYTIEHSIDNYYLVLDSSGSGIHSASFELWYNSTTLKFFTEDNLQPQSEIPTTPTNVDMGGVGIGAANGVLTVRSSDLVHSGDIPWTTFPVSSAASHYSSSKPLRYRKWGRVVDLMGAVRPNADVPAGMEYSLNIGTLPEGCRPQEELTQLCQGSGTASWMLRITTGGVVTAERYRTGSGYAVMPAPSGGSSGAWLTMNCTFIV